MKIDIKKFFTSVIDWGKDHASDLKMGVGTAGVVGGTVVLCKSMCKASEIVREYREAKQELINDGAEKKDIRKLTGKAVGKVVWTILPGAMIESGGLVLMWSGYSDMKAAFVSVGIAYSGLQEFIDKYREGVREKYGKETDEQLAYQFRTEEVTVVKEDGTETTETVRIYPHDAKDMPSPYARYFCYGEADGAERSFTYNKKFLELQQDLMNRYFKAHRKLMLNDAYDMLGIRQSMAGFHVGWIFDPETPEGDNMVDLRIQEVYRETAGEDRTENGWERVLMIDPNVDGMVEEKMVRMGLIDE